ncbi:MAG: HAMP domain-containing sensor histidine kinase [Haloarculaceae archaeon]
MATASTERGRGAVPATALTVLGIGIIAAAVAHDVRFGTGELLTGMVAMPGVLLLGGLVYILWSSLDAATYWTVARWVFGGFVTLGGGVGLVVYLGADLGGTGVSSFGRTTLQVLFFAGLGTVGGLLVGIQSVRAVEEARRAEEARTNALMYAAERDRLSQLSETSHALLKAEEENRVAELLASGVERAIPDATCAVWLTGHSGFEPVVDGTPASPDRAGAEGFDDGRERTVNAPDAGERLYVPLAEHGLLAVTLPRNRGFDDRGLDLVRVYARTGQTALDRAANQEALERQNERLDEFASVVSHDLRGPLSVIVGRAELARETGDVDHVDAIVESAERMDRLIEDVLALARQGEDATECERVGLREAALAAWSAVGTLEASVDVAEELPVVSGDREQLQRLFENLFRNAVEHGGEDVSVSVRPLGDAGCAVVDDGPGVPADEREKVFDRGYSTGGTGLGLAIVDDIVDGHGGTVSVTEAEGGGARFEVRDLGLHDGPFAASIDEDDPRDGEGKDGPGNEEGKGGSGNEEGTAGAVGPRGSIGSGDTAI